MSTPKIQGLERGIKEALLRVPAAERPEVYAISFYIYDEADDPRLPTLTVGSNSESQFEISLGDAGDAEEARWNYAFWRQDELGFFGSEGSDPSGRAISDWIVAQGLSYSDDEEENDEDRCYELGEEITRRFIEVVSKTARELHDSGFIAEAFGRPIPVLIHELEYYDEIADQIERANPPGVADDFVAWVRGMGDL